MSRFQLDFLPLGSVVDELLPCAIFMDVGGSRLENVFDQHQQGSLFCSSTGLVVAEFDRLSAVVSGCESVRVVTHKSPDLDAICSTWIAIQAIEGLKLPTRFMVALAEYVDGIDQGLTEISSPYVVSLYSAVSIGLALIPGEDDHENTDFSTAARGHRFLDILSSISYFDFDNLNCLPDAGYLEAMREALCEDFRLYKADLSRAKKFEIQLPAKTGRHSNSVLCVAIKRPDSRLFKSWARGDLALRPGPMLMIGVSDSRTIFSLPPYAQVSLKGFADALQALEDKKIGLKEDKKPLSPRPGYSSSDPWYDGRGNNHDYSIVDSPRRGTVLSWSELERALVEFASGR